jgi:hypothetical protein
MSNRDRLFFTFVMHAIVCTLMWCMVDQADQEVIDAGLVVQIAGHRELSKG